MVAFFQLSFFKILLFLPPFLDFSFWPFPEGCLPFSMLPMLQGARAVSASPLRRFFFSPRFSLLYSPYLPLLAPLLVDLFRWLAHFSTTPGCLKVTPPTYDAHWSSFIMRFTHLSLFVIAHSGSFLHFLILYLF